jgi:hypothetical protein
VVERRRDDSGERRWCELNVRGEEVWLAPGVRAPFYPGKGGGVQAATSGNKHKLPEVNGIYAIEGRAGLRGVKE